MEHSTKTFQVPSGAIGTTVSVAHGLSVAPKFAILKWTNRTEGTDTAGRSDQLRGLAFLASPTNRAAACTRSTDNVSTTSTGKRYHEDACVMACTNNGGLDGLMDLQSWDATNAVFVVDDQFSQSANIRVIVDFFTGDDITNVTIVDFLHPTSTGNQDITTPGFQADQVFIMSTGATAVAPIGTDDSLICFGAGHSSSKRGVWVGDANDGIVLGNTVTRSYCNGSEIAAMFDTGAVNIIERADYSGGITNGFRLNWLEVSGTQKHWIALVIQGGNWTVESFNTKTDGTDIVVTGGFNALGGFLVSAFKAVDAADTPSIQDRISMGSFAGLSARAALATSDRHGATTATHGTTAISYTAVAIRLDETSDAVLAAMDIKSMSDGSSTGVTFVMDTPEPTAASFGWVVLFGSSSSTFAYIGGGAAVMSGAAATLYSRAAMTFTYIPVFPGEITLGWNPNPEPDVAGYIVRWGTQSRIYTNSQNVGLVSQVTIGGLTRGVTYYFVLAAYDTSNNVGPNSAEFSAQPTVGALEIGGAALTQVLSGFNYSPSGGVAVAGAADYSRDLFFNISGGAVMGGGAQCNREWARNMSGGLNVFGNAFTGYQAFGVSTFVYAGSGNVLISGDALINHVWDYVGGGSFSILGSALTAFPRGGEDAVIVCVEIDFDNGTQYFGFEGISTPSQWYQDELVSIGQIRREVPLLPGEFQVADVELVFNNVGNKFSILKAAQPFRNRTARIKCGLLSNGFAGLSTLFTGKISSWTFSDSLCHVVVRDVSLDRFRVNLSGQLGKTDFPNLPDGQTLYLIPRIYGTVSSAMGALPAYRTNQVSPFRYVVARHACKSVLQVYNYGTLMTSGYSIVTTSINGTTMTCLDFLTDPQISSRTNEFEITVNVSGKIDASLNLITNPVAQLQDYLLNEVGVPSGDIDSTVFNAMQIAAADQELFGDFAITDSGLTHMDVVTRFSESFGMPFYVSRAGQYRVFLFSGAALVDLESIPLLSDSDDILRNSFKIDYNVDVASRLQYNYAYQYVLNYFEHQPDLIDANELANIGFDVRLNTDLWHVRDLGTALSTASDRMAYLRENVQLASFDLPIYQYALDLNDYFRLTHYQGVSSDGLGYAAILFRILSLTISLQPKSMQVSVMGYKFGENIPFWRRYIKLGDESAISPLWTTATSSDKDYGYLADESDPTGSPEGTLGTSDPAKLLL
jgi:hypothetical protein